MAFSYEKNPISVLRDFFKISASILTSVWQQLDANFFPKEQRILTSGSVGEREGENMLSICFAVCTIQMNHSTDLRQRVTSDPQLQEVTYSVPSTSRSPKVAVKPGLGVLT